MSFNSINPFIKSSLYICSESKTETYFLIILLLLLTTHITKIKVHINKNHPRLIYSVVTKEAFPPPPTPHSHLWLILLDPEVLNSATLT